MTVNLAKSLQQQIIQHLETGYPNEAGGFLLGEVTHEAIIIRQITGVANVWAAEEQFHRYAMTPQDWARLEDEADEQGLTLVGYFHSHPDSPAIPSVFDRDHALPNFTYIITQVNNRQAIDMRVWRLRHDRTAFDEEVLLIT
ncbi:MAG: M67 family metallopeptidase [Anaerolineae bacterium]|nr:M67 family metallopeptidase [Anaerolineae bacterium]